MRTRTAKKNKKLANCVLRLGFTKRFYMFLVADGVADLDPGSGAF
jgi:hypothetical protein